MDLVQQFEMELRVGSFFVLLGGMLVWEHFRARRPGRVRRWLRRANNLALLSTSAVIIYVLFPVASVGAAHLAEAHGLGLLHMSTVNPWTAGLLAFLLLDLAIYGQHIAFHKVPLLWRLHRVHHSDPDFDTTTGVRFHPLELIVSLLWKIGVVTLLGAPVSAVIIFETVLNGTALFNHGNVSLPPAIERWARWLLVTPDVHRVHHSARRTETDSNYGTSLIWWDRLFRTFTPQPQGGHTGMRIGLEDFGSEQSIKLWSLLIQPLVQPPRRISSASS